MYARAPVAAHCKPALPLAARATADQSWHLAVQARRTRPSLLVKFVALANGSRNVLLMPEVLKSFVCLEQVSAMPTI